MLNSWFFNIKYINDSINKIKEQKKIVINKTKNMTSFRKRYQRIVSIVIIVQS